MLHSLLNAVAFLTRLPVRASVENQRALGRAAAFFPLVGALLGGAAAVTAWGVGLIADGRLAALAAVALVALLTGALHLDGLADVFDGLGAARRDRERMLAILRDSRIGTFGVLGLLVVVLGKLWALEKLIFAEQWWTIAAAPVLGRWCASVLVVIGKPARPEGLGRSFRDAALPSDLVPATLFLVTGLGGAVMVEGGALLWGALAGALAAGLLATFLASRLGGFTGDTDGACIELAELAFWLTSVLAADGGHAREAFG